MPFDDRWTSVSNDLLWQALIDLFERSIFHERWFVTIVENLFRLSLYRSLNDLFHLSFDDLSLFFFFFTAIVLFNIWKIVSNDLFMWSANNKFIWIHLRLLNDRFKRSFKKVIGWSFSKISFYDRFTNSPTIFLTISDRSFWGIHFREWQIFTIVADRFCFQRLILVR